MRCATNILPVCLRDKLAAEIAILHTYNLDSCGPSTLSCDLAEFGAIRERGSHGNENFLSKCQFEVFLISRGYLLIIRFLYSWPQQYT